jgi:hypothetical protein
MGDHRPAQCDRCGDLRRRVATGLAIGWQAASVRRIAANIAELPELLTRP